LAYARSPSGHKKTAAPEDGRIRARYEKGCTHCWAQLHTTF
jgi:hypothetical protein